MARVFGILVCAGDLHFGRKTCIRGSVSSEMEGLGEVWIINLIWITDQPLILLILSQTKEKNHHVLQKPLC